MIDKETCRKEAVEMLLKPGVYKWCMCGLSMTSPFCDDSHLATGVEPVFTKIEKEKLIYWCGCGGSKNVPYCDGTEPKNKPEELH